jgi:hypothetical protein
VAGCRAVAAVVAMLALCEPLSPAPRFAPLSSWDAAVLERARAGALRRLERPECQSVLHDFTDREGNSLHANLEPWGLTPSEYLQRSIAFRDGSTLQICRRETVLLVTSPGQVSVFVCPSYGAVPGSRFARVQRENPALAEAMIIHEMLHALGLGENPPSSFEITDRVLERCH